MWLYCRNHIVGWFFSKKFCRCVSASKVPFKTHPFSFAYKENTRYRDLRMSFSVSIRLIRVWWGGCHTDLWGDGCQKIPSINSLSKFNVAILVESSASLGCLKVVWEDRADIFRGLLLFNLVYLKSMKLMKACYYPRWARQHYSAAQL